MLSIGGTSLHSASMAVIASSPPAGLTAVSPNPQAGETNASTISHPMAIHLRVFIFALPNVSKGVVIG